MPVSLELIHSTPTKLGLLFTKSLCSYGGTATFLAVYLSIGSLVAGNFMPGDESGTIMKKSDAKERKALHELMSDNLRNFVPEFKKVIEKDGHCKCLRVVAAQTWCSY